MLASFHLVDYRARSVAGGQARVAALDRRAIGRTDGLHFWRLLFTAIGKPNRPRGFPVPDPGRSAFLAVWEDEGALDAFLASSPVCKRWRSHARESWHVRLQPVHTHGTWGGKNPFANAVKRARIEGPAALLTYIHLKPRGHPPFWRALPGISAQLAGHPGVRAAVLLTEAPLGALRRNVTFSLWSSVDQAMNFSYEQPQSSHDVAMRRSQEERWYHEACFVRFQPYESSGTWGGRDPLRAAASTPGEALTEWRALYQTHPASPSGRGS